MRKRIRDVLPKAVATLGAAGAIALGVIVGYIGSPTAPEPDARIYIQWACGHEHCANVGASEYGAVGHFKWSTVDNDFSQITNYLNRLGAVNRKGGMVVQIYTDMTTAKIWTPSSYDFTHEVCLSESTSIPVACRGQCVTIPAFDDSRYVNGYLDFIERLGAEFNGNANLEFVLIADGIWDESAPGYNDYGSNNCDFYDAAVGAVGGEDYFWGEWAPLVAKAYRAAFPDHFVYWQGSMANPGGRNGMMAVIAAESDPVGYKNNGFLGRGAKNWWTDRTDQDGMFDAMVEYEDDVPFAAEAKHLPSDDQTAWSVVYQMLHWRPDFIAVQPDLSWIDKWGQLGVLDWLEDRLGKLPTEDDVAWWVPHKAEVFTASGAWSDWPYDYGTMDAVEPTSDYYTEREFRYLYDPGDDKLYDNPAWLGLVPAGAREDKRARHIAVVRPGQKLAFQIDSDWKYRCQSGETEELKVTIDYLDNSANGRLYVMQNDGLTEAYTIFNSGGVDTNAFVSDSIFAADWVDTSQVCGDFGGSADFYIENRHASESMIIAKVEIEGRWVGANTPTPTVTGTATGTPTATPTGTATPTATTAPLAKNSVFVATDGEDSNAGTLSAPVLTVNRAREIVRNGIVGGMTADMYVYIRDGEYYVTNPIIFEPADSGVDGYEVIYRNYPGEEPVLIGGSLVTGWELHSGNVYKADVSDWVPFYALMENDELGTLAREPDSGYLQVDSQVSLECRDCGGGFTFGYAAGEEPFASGFGYRDATVVVKLASQGGDGQEEREYWTEVLAIDSIDWTRREVTVDKHVTWYPIQEDDNYYVRGSLDFLDRPGEWYLDHVTGWLYYWPKSTPIGSQEIVAARTQDIMILNGDGVGGDYVENIRLQGLTFRLGDFGPRNWLSPPAWQEGEQEHALVTVRNANYVTVTCSTFENAPWGGVWFGDHVQGSEVSHSTFEHMGRNGVVLTGLEEGNTNHVNFGNTVHNNYFNDGYGDGVGLWVADQKHKSAAVALYRSGGNDVTNNEVVHWPNMGIAMNGPSWTTIDDEHSACPGCWDYLHSKDNVFRYNDVSKVLEDSNDGGGIYLYGGGKYNEVDYNLVYDIVSGNTVDSNTQGIYVDGLSSWVTVTNNIVYGIGGEPGVPMMVKGMYNLVRNNIIVDNTGQMDTPSTPLDLYIVSKKNTATGIEYGHQTITRNVFYRDEGDLVYYWHWWEYDGDKPVEAVDNNVFWHPGGDVSIRTEGDTHTLAEWQALDGGVYDQNSVEDNPLFRDVLDNDYWLESGSPALTLGFEQIDTGLIGRLALDCEDDEPVSPTATPTPTATPVDPLSRLVLEAKMDTYIDSDSPTVNYGEEGVVRLDGEAKSALIEFSSVKGKFDNMAYGAEVSSAALVLRVMGVSGEDSLAVSVYPLARSWTEYEATWNVPRSGETWNVAGAKGEGDRTTPVTTGTLDRVGVVTLDVTSIVKEWAKGTRIQYGFLLEGGAGGARIELAPTEVGDTKLSVWYRSVSPTPTSTPTATLTPTPKVVVGLTPPANPVYPGTWDYRMVVTNSGGQESDVWLAFRPPTGAGTPAATPPMGWDGNLEELRLLRSFLPGGAHLYIIEMDAPQGDSHSAEAEVWRGDWHTYATVVVTPIVAGTATPTPTLTPTPVGTATETPTVTPTWTPTVTPTPWSSAPYIVFNEVIPIPEKDHNRDGLVDNDDQALEFYNRGVDEVEMEYWYVVVYDESGERGRKGFPAGFSLDGGTWWVMRPAQLGFYLPYTGWVELYDGSGTEKDSVEWTSEVMVPMGRYPSGIPSVQAGVGLGRLPDGVGGWVGMQASPGYSNGWWATPTPTPGS